jgi:hypothetical protein
MEEHQMQNYAEEAKQAVDRMIDETGWNLPRTEEVWRLMLAACYAQGQRDALAAFAAKSLGGDAA